MRRFTEPKLVVASHNEGKVSEIRALLDANGGNIDKMIAALKKFG